jgi:hypothetical protein
MASIKLEVTVEDLTNDELDKVDDIYYKHLASVCRSPHSSLPGNVTDVSEIERDEDEEDDEETED